MRERAHRDDQLGRLARTFKPSEQPSIDVIRTNGRGLLTSLPSIERSRHASSEVHSSGRSPKVRKTATTAVAGLIASAMLAGVVSVVVPDGRAVAKGDAKKHHCSRSSARKHSARDNHRGSHKGKRCDRLGSKKRP